MRVLRIGHSPDPDDAFMFYGFACGAVQMEGYEIEHVLEDIATLNVRATRGELEVTALSAATYPHVAGRYRLLATGASLGIGYGPVIVCKKESIASELTGRTIAVPGKSTTAYLLLRLYLEDFQAVEIPFDRIPQAVRAGEVDAGLLIHEGQLTYAEMGLVPILDLGARWREETGFPLPLGLDAVRRDLAEDLQARISQALAESIRYAFAHEEEALDYAMQFGRGIDREICRRFVRMYVNEYTLDLGGEGKRALLALYQRAYDRGLIPAVPPLDPTFPGKTPS
ncbi:MAG: MqnA/MqnD/SBP family protein [Armatimonadota bacterium]|nr:MqnA/MqnD/SBP family protein [Armatimonadota bacterium]MDR5704135.1 MqnA/MqnD/SBP family protein [Armatimonadota bacterium]MDR7433731.1 MqnA/MqnD/SBP family protein [Armatimonadota bacterium]